MKLTSCPRCERHVLVEAASCPFCGTRLGTTSAIGRAMMIAVVGLSMSCGGDDSTESTVGATQGDPTVGATGETSINNNEVDSGGADYAGPETSLSAGPTTADEGTSTSGTTGTGSDTDTDTGSTTGAPATDSGGADYAGPGTTTG